MSICFTIGILASTSRCVWIRWNYRAKEYPVATHQIGDSAIFLKHVLDSYMVPTSDLRIATVNLLDYMLCFGLSHFILKCECLVANVVVGSVIAFLAPVALGLASVT